VVAQDLIKLSKRFLTEAGADGIFYAVHNFSTITKVDYLNVFTPAERLIADEIAAVKNYTILHVCGGLGKQNDFSYYANYPYKALNYSVANEKLSLAEAKKKFPDKAIIGGFNRDENALIHTGTKEQLQAETKKLVEEAGRDRLIIGADCSLVTNKMSYEKVAWIKEIADTL
jgi:uroporphyrinogen decarboxylase